MPNLALYISLAVVGIAIALFLVLWFAVPRAKAAPSREQGSAVPTGVVVPRAKAAPLRAQGSAVPTGVVDISPRAIPKPSDSSAMPPSPWPDSNPNSSIPTPEPKSETEPKPIPKPEPDKQPSYVYGWNGLRDVIHDNVDATVVFTYSYVPADVRVSQNSSELTRDQILAPCGLNFQTEVTAAFEWWRECLFLELGARVVFQLLGVEQNVENNLVGGAYAATEERVITNREKHNMGDIRIAIWDFSATNSAQALMYAYPAGPTGDAHEAYQYANPRTSYDLFGNVYINSMYQWRARDASQSCGVSLAFVLAHELGHCLGLFHDCDASNDGVASGQLFDCGGVEHVPGSAIMKASATSADNLPDACSAWTAHHLGEIYTPSGSSYAVLARNAVPCVMFASPAAHSHRRLS